MQGFGRFAGLVSSAAVGAALLVGGCSSSGTVGATAPQAGTGGSTTHAITSASGGYNGTWKGTADGGPVTLTVDKDKAELKTPHDCPGSFDGQLFLLTCQDGDTDRQTGSAVLSSDHKTLTVSWDDGITDTLTKDSAH